ncbi:hypothetical protein [Bdellovibrio sp.]|uniref:hypothetical protein n=1 Tax=Bdellovibrio sp. TaxID=28201 RepID=UPI003221C603
MTLDEVIKSDELQEAKLKTPYVKDIIYQNALFLLEGNHLSDAKAKYRRILCQEDLKEYYMDHVWKNRDDNFTSAETLLFLSRATKGEPIREIVKHFLNDVAETANTEED